MSRIVELIPTMNTGGAETMVKDYCLLLKSMGHEICVITIESNEKSSNEIALRDNGIRVISINSSTTPRVLEKSIAGRLIRRISRVSRLKRTINEIDPDVIHAHLSICRYLLRMNPEKYRLFLTVHNVIERYYSQDRDNRIKYKEYKSVYELIHKYGMRLITLHDSLNRELREYFQTDNVYTINNGIYTSRFAPELYEANKERASLGIEQNDIVVGHVGRFHQQKNHELILEIFYDLYNKDDRFRLILVGSGELKQKIMDRVSELNISDRVIMLSNRSDIPRLMSVMDVFLFPSRWEGFGNVLIEAQCMGLPCIVSDVVPKEVRVTDRVFTVSLDEPADKWKEAIYNALDGKKGCEPIGCIDEFDIENSVRNLQRLYQGETIA